MTKVVVVVHRGIVESVYTRNKNIEVELVDLDCTDSEGFAEKIKRVRKIENSKSYKDVL